MADQVQKGSSTKGIKPKCYVYQDLPPRLSGTPPEEGNKENLGLKFCSITAITGEGHCILSGLSIQLCSSFKSFGFIGDKSVKSIS